MLAHLIYIIALLAVGASVGLFCGAWLAEQGFPTYPLCIAFLALLAFAPGRAEAMTKHECVQAGYGCQWSKKTGGRHDGWYFERAKIGAHLREGLNHAHRRFQETNGPTRPSFVSTTDLAATPPGASQVAVWSIALSKISIWPSEARSESQLAFQQVALLAYGARNFEKHWREAWNR